MARWMRVGCSRAKTRFDELVKPFAVVLHSVDEDAKKEQFDDEDIRSRVEYERVAARLLDAVGPAIERMVLAQYADLPRSRR